MKEKLAVKVYRKDGTFEGLYMADVIKVEDGILLISITEQKNLGEKPRKVGIAYPIDALLRWEVVCLDDDE